MQMIDVLIQMPLDRLYALAKLWKVPFRKLTKGPDTDTLYALEGVYNNPTTILERIAGLSERLQEALMTIYALLPSHPRGLPYAEVFKKVSQSVKPRTAAESIISELETEGLAFRYYNGWNDMMLMPQQVTMALDIRIALPIVEYINREGAAVGKVRVLENRGLAFYHDLMTLLGAIANERIEVSQKRHIYKRTANKLLSKLRSSSTYFPTFFDNDGLDTQIHFFEKFLGRTRLVEFNGLAQIQTEETERFLGTHYADWAVMVFEFYLMHINNNRNVSLTLLSILSGKIAIDKWVRCEVLSEQLDSYLSKYHIRITAEQLKVMCFDPWIMLGLIQLGQDEQGQQVWQWTAWGREFVRLTSGSAHHQSSALTELLSMDMFVQPNMEIMIPENILPSIRWKIEALAELKQADAVLIYELSKKRILHALECGWTMDSIKTFLGKFSKVPVAENVYQTIKGWIGNYGVAELWDVMVVQIKDPQVAAWVSADKQLSKLIVSFFSPQAFVIRRKDEVLVREAMGKLGYVIPRNIMKVEPQVKSQKESYYALSAQGGGYEDKIASKNGESLAPQLLQDALTIEAVAVRFITLDDLEILQDFDDDDYLDDEDEDGWDFPY